MATKSIKSAIPKKEDFSKWTPEKFLSFIVFNGIFVRTDEEGVVRDDVTREKVDLLSVTDDPFWAEFMKRILKKDIGLNTFRLRLKAFAQNCGSYLQENPTNITQDITDAVKSNPRWQWILTAYAEKRNAIGAGQIVPANQSTPLADTKTPLAQYHQGLLEMATLFKKVVKGISQEEINKLSTKDRLRIANLLSHTLSKAVTTQQNTKVFNTLVINKAGREDLEKSMLEYQESQNTLQE